MFQTSKSFLLPFFIVINALLISFGSQQYLDEYTLQIARTTKIVDDLQTVKTVKKIGNKTMNQIRCMALGIYYESRGEPFLGQVAVARVIMNRVKSGLFPSTYCDVIYQNNEINIDNENKIVCQFSWVCDTSISKDEIPKNATYQEIEKIARDVILENKWADVLSKDVLFFHANSVNPKWSQIYNHVTTIGNHLFYEKKK